MRSENMYKRILIVYHITKILSPLYKVVVAEHDGDGSF